jgi:hypothetical protein
VSGSFFVSKPSDKNADNYLCNSPRTNAYGEASFTFTAPVAPATVTVKVYDTDARGLITLTKSVTVE